MSGSGGGPVGAGAKPGYEPAAIAVDSSVAIAAILADDELHEAAEQALAESERTIAHVAAETYSVLTRIPPPHRLDAKTAASVLERRLPATHVTLSTDRPAPAVRVLADAQVSGGATYDGVIALTAVEHRLELISRDRRATRTYDALGVRYRVLS